MTSQNVETPCATFCNKLFKIEKTLKNLSSEHRALTCLPHQVIHKCCDSWNAVKTEAGLALNFRVQMLRINFKSISRVKPTNFRSPSRVRNRVLYGLMLVEDIKTIEMAELIGVSHRAVEHWIADGIIPKQARQDKLAEILKCPPHILFSEVD